MKKVKLFLWYQFPAIFWICAIFVQSSIPDLSAPDLGFNLQDKFAHFIEFSILAILLFRATINSKSERTRNRSFYLTIIIGIVYAVFDEVHQLFVPGRSAEVADAVADTIGVLFAVFFYSLLLKLKFFVQHRFKFFGNK